MPVCESQMDLVCTDTLNAGGELLPVYESFKELVKSFPYERLQTERYCILFNMTTYIYWPCEQSYGISWQETNGSISSVFGVSCSKCRNLGICVILLICIYLQSVKQATAAAVTHKSYAEEDEQDAFGVPADLLCSGA